MTVTLIRGNALALPLADNTVSDLMVCDRRRRSIAYRHARAKHPGPWDGCGCCADRAREASR